jgi:hypothetical protein
MISGRLLARFGSGLIGLTGTNDVIIKEDASESTSESSSSSPRLSEESDESSDEEDVDISESSFGRDRSSNTPRPRFCVSGNIIKLRVIND